MSVLAVVAFRLKMDAKETSVVVHRTADIQESIGAYPSSRRLFRHRDTHSLGIHQSADANFRERQEGSPTEFATLYRIEFWKMDLGAFTGRGQGGPCLTDAAQ